MTREAKIAETVEMLYRRYEGTFPKGDLRKSAEAIVDAPAAPATGPMYVPDVKAGESAAQMTLDIPGVQTTLGDA